MRYHRYFLLLNVLIGLVSVNSAFGIAVPSVSVSDASVYPYEAEITGDSVNIRTGAGTAFYEFGKLYRGDRVTVVGDKDGVWSKILPLEGSFSWISAQYITITPSDSTIGEVTGDNVRVWAGSPLYGPERSTTPQGKMNKGQKVKILGQPVNNYYKIAVPKLPDAYYWVYTEYTKPIPKETGTVRPVRIPSSDPTVPVAVPVDSTNTDTETIGPIPVISEGNNVTIDPNMVAQIGLEVQVTPLDKYYVLQKQVDEERAKPIKEQDYSEIKKALLEIVNDEKAEKASIYAKAVLDRVEGIELALQIDDILKEQNDKFKESKDKIESAYAKKVKEIKDLGKYAVIGTLKDFRTLGSGRYRVVDSSDTTICSAVPSQSVMGKDFSGFVDKKVGLVGTIEPDAEISSAKVRFTEVVVLE